jgi:putative transposase
MGNKREPFLPETIYHIYNHSIGSSDLFLEEANYYYFLDLFKKHISPFTEVYAYCLLPNHFHFLLKIESFKLIEEVMKEKGYAISTSVTMKSSQKISHLFGNMFNAYAKGMNKRYHRMGSNFIARVKRKVVYNKEYLKQLILYINLNPVHHGIAKNLEEWPYSSYNQTNFGNSYLLTYQKTISYFDSIIDFRLCHQEALEIIKKAGETGPLEYISI